MIKNHLKKFTLIVFVTTLIFLSLIIGPVTCNSGWASPSIGTQGACSHHGGVAKWKREVPIIFSTLAAFLFYIAFSPKFSLPDVAIRKREPSNLDEGPSSVKHYNTPPPKTKSVHNISIVGTNYYKATEIFRSGLLSSGMDLALEHQKDNPYDSNAVAVKIRDTGEMLGYIPRDSAPIYAELLNKGKHLRSSIAEIKGKGRLPGLYININIYVASDMTT